MRLAILASHPIQYQAPIFRELARRMDVVVYFAHRATRGDQADAGFGVGFEWDIDLLAGYEHHFLPNISRHPGLDQFSGCDTPSVREVLDPHRFDALLVMGWHLKSFWQAIWAAKRAGLAVMVRGDSQLESPRSPLKRAVKSFVYPVALRAFDIALYVGVRSRRYWEYYHFPRERLVFSPHCVDNAWFAERATTQARRSLRAKHHIAEDSKVLLFAGKLVPFKRPLDLILAAASVGESIPGLTVLVAGDGPLAGEMSLKSANAGVKLVHLGFCNQTAMPSAYAAADALVLPSDARETWGLVANEALACGRPVIVSDACGCSPDLAEDRKAGRAFSMGSLQSLEQAIATILTTPPAPGAIQEKASQYSILAAADGVSGALEMLSARRSRAA